MSYAVYASFRMNQALRMPFADFAQPIRAFGETVHQIVEAATWMIETPLRAIWIGARERAVIDALSRLDDRMLNDIGIARSEIRVLARLVVENPGIDHRKLCR